MARPSWLNRCTRWTTLVALVLATLAPGIAHALRHERGQALPWQEICTATGAMRNVVVGDDGAPAQAHAFEHCLTCLLHHGASAPPSAPLALPAAPTVVEAVPALFLHAPRPLFAWRSAQPRAPPALS
jgi:hypothetical protein